MEANNFEMLVGEQFSVPTAQKETYMTLAGVRDRGEGRFSLVFTGNQELDTGMQQFNHNEIGSFSASVLPIMDNYGGYQYEVIFD